MTSPDPYGHVDDFFGGGVPAISFDDRKGYVRGTPKGGRILAIRPKQQQTEYKTNKPATWDNGDPKYTLPIELQTSERNSQDPHDDGRRTLWVSGGVERAIREELKTKRAKLRPGGDLFVAWVAGEGQDGDPKQYRALYTPAAHAEADAMFTAPPQHAAPPAAAAPQWGAPASPTGPAPGQWGAPPAQPPAAAAPTGRGAPPAPQPPAGLWDQPAQPNGWPPANAGQAPAPAAPAGWGAAPTATPQMAPQPPAQPAPQAPAGPLDPGAIDAAYGHLSPDQRAAIVASGMSPEQIASVYGPPQMAGAR